MIQAPLTEVRVNTFLDESIVFDTTFDVVGIQSFKAFDLIQIDDREIVQVQSIGVGSNKQIRCSESFRWVQLPFLTVLVIQFNSWVVTTLSVIQLYSSLLTYHIGTTTGGPDNIDWTHTPIQGRPPRSDLTTKLTGLVSQLVLHSKVEPL